MDEAQSYQFGSSFPLGKFVPIIVKSAIKNRPSTGKISPLVTDVIFPGSSTVILTLGTRPFASFTFTHMTGWIFGNKAACSLFGNGGCVSFCGYMRNNFQSELFTTTKAYPSMISDCGGKNLTSMDMELAALNDFEAGCIGKLIAALTDSMWKCKKYSRESGNPVPIPKSSAIMEGMLPEKVNVADFDPQLVVLLRSACVTPKSGAPAGFWLVRVVGGGMLASQPLPAAAMACR
ncbi:MAG: hypothetical protein ABSH48_26990 [Verrucomicrobiota bacterium]